MALRDSGTRTGKPHLKLVWGGGGVYGAKINKNGASKKNLWDEMLQKNVMHFFAMKKNLFSKNLPTILLQVLPGMNESGGTALQLA